MRRLTCSLEMSILVLLSGVVLVLALFGLLSQVDAAPFLPPSAPAVVTTQVLLRFSKTVDAWVPSSAVQGLNADATSYSGDIANCNDGFGRLAGYRVRFTYKQIRFEYHADADLKTIVLCHVGLR